MFVRLFLGSFILIFSIIAHRSMYEVCYLFYFPISISISICISVWSLVMKIPYLNHLKNDFKIEYLNYTINLVRTLFIPAENIIAI